MPAAEAGIVGQWSRVAWLALWIGAAFFTALPQGWLPRPALSLSILIALAVWVAAQNLGGILTGSATDVGTGPVWILLALAFWPAGRTGVPRAGEPAAAASRRPENAREAAGIDPA